MIDIPDFVYPKDSSGKDLCPRCLLQVAACQCPDLRQIKQAAPKKQVLNPHVRLEKSGRNGKVVTIFYNLPAQHQPLKDLAKKLKTKTGTGGTYYIKEGQGYIELQGDHRGLVVNDI